MSGLAEERKVNLIEVLFERPESEIDSQDYEPYFQMIDAEIRYLNDCREFRDLFFKLDAEQLTVVALITVPILKHNPSAEEETVLDSLQAGDVLGIQGAGLPQERTILKYILDGIIRIWLMVDPTPVAEQHITGWRGRRKLCDFVHGLFYPAQDAPKFPGKPETPIRDAELVAEMASETTQVQSSLTHPLTVANMKKLTNITAYWITQLDKHLECPRDGAEMEEGTYT
ncbi:hypothetical protein FBEOM_4408 [Fusarium beomiforme]|uniref:Uncharacterized protein n=1 Tax=Fusarium beomiforme TaxID=44412 RepID=A0A9P5AMU6_9HYPO|nr:hypothetical protein FBEOM_4408 [Fusarium beomiforme]